MTRYAQLTWDASATAAALGIATNDYICPLRYDGRYATATVTYLLIGRGWTALENKTGHLFRLNSGSYKPRCVTDNGIDFDPSYCRGFGRTQSPARTQNSLDEIEGFVVFFAADLPDTTIWLVTTEDVRRWIAAREITEYGHGSYTTMRRLLA